MDVSGEAVGAMQAYLRLKRYILPSGVAREALQAALPFIAPPSAAREPALEEVKTSGATDVRGLIKTYANAAFEQQGNDIPKYIWHLHFEEFAAAIRALSSPANADAGKVEGDGWMPIESAPHNEKVLLSWKDCLGEWTFEVFEASWGYRTDTVSNVSTHGKATHWRPLPSAPSEGAE